MLDPDVADMVAHLRESISEWIGWDVPEEGSEDCGTLEQMTEDGDAITTVRGVIAYCETWNMPGVEALFEGLGYTPIAVRSRRKKGSLTVLAQSPEDLEGGACVEAYAYHGGLILRRPPPYEPQDPGEGPGREARQRPVLVTCHRHPMGEGRDPEVFFARLVAALHPAPGPDSVKRMEGESIWRVVTAISEAQFRSNLQAHHDPAHSSITFLEP